ncbi:hypothetical protein IJ596_03745 [bacterium]|nr:hypothetical protein [bacterium]
MKKVLLILFLFCFASVSDAATLSGGIKYSQEDARLELQNNKPSADFLFRASAVDEYFDENISNILKGVTKLNDRTLAQFSDGSYGVNYYNDPKHVWYYDRGGTLINAEVRTSTVPPYSTYKYDPDGSLVNMSMRVSDEETFIFSPQGQLLGHWLGENCYDENNNVVMTRQILK